MIYALQNKLGAALMKNKAGKFVEGKLDGVTAAAQGVANNMPADLRASIVNADGEAAYPISTFTWPSRITSNTSQAVASRSDREAV